MQNKIDGNKSEMKNESEKIKPLTMAEKQQVGLVLLLFFLFLVFLILVTIALIFLPFLNSLGSQILQSVLSFLLMSVLA